MILYWILSIFLLISGSLAQNETIVTPTDTTVNTDPRCLPGCTFESSLIDSATLKYFPKNCTTVCTASALYIGYETDLTEKQLTEAFKNMKHLIGDLIVNRSKYKSSRFLASLETVDCYNFGFFKWTLNSNMTEIGLPNVTTVSCRVEIKGNANLTRLNLPKMIPTQSSAVNYSTIDVEISFNAADFCITHQEMSNLMTHDYIEFDQITGSFCDVFDNSTSSSSNETRICDLVNYTWSGMHMGCEIVIGDVMINEENEEHAVCLESVQSIFGSLIIFGTNLTNTDFLGNLEHIISLTPEQPALVVSYNEQLTNFSVPQLERVISQIYVPIVFNNNSEALMKSPSTCFALRDSVTDKQTWIVKFDDKVCEDVEKGAAVVVKDKSSTSIFSVPVMIIVVCLGLIFRD